MHMPRHFIKTLARLSTAAVVLAALLMSASCVDEHEYADTPADNFEALWRIIDEHYCFFEYKREAYGLDWNEVKARYAGQIDPRMSDTQLFEVLGNMLAELRDGHVNMYSSWDTSRYWSWKEDYPSNVSDTLLNLYLGTDYRMVSGLKYRRLDDNTGYVRCPSFANSFGDGNLDNILFYLAPCNGLIIDIRDNGGGLLTAAEKLAARFTDRSLHVGYMQHKTGPCHDAFSDPEPQTLKPSRGMRWHKPVVVLTNRAVYSAANEFVKYMKCCPQVTVIGDRTGGGAGLPFSSELPSGWSIRFSACPMYDRDMQSTEFGIEPDHYVSLSQEELLKGRDSIIEYARKIIAQGQTGAGVEGRTAGANETGL